MTILKPDLCIIGAGSGGLSVAAGAVQMGASGVLIEGGTMGGDCLNTGCVPSKALLAAGAQAHAMTTGAPFGVTPIAPQVNYAAAKDHVAKVIATIAPHDSVERFEGLGCTVIQGWAEFVDKRTVVAAGQRIAARRFVVATGSTPAAPPIPGLADVGFLTNETIFALRERPAHLLIIGAGPIGLEMAQAHRRLGSEVTVVEMATALSADDPELAAVVVEALRSEGVRILENTGVVGAVRSEAGTVVLSLNTGEDITGDAVLVAAGRKPALDRLNLAVAGVSTGQAGVEVDRGLRTSNCRIYAIGDATGGMQFTHVAGYEAGLVIRSALFRMPVKARYDHIPYATYTSPELASVGMSEAAARDEFGDKLEVVTADMSGNDRALAMGTTKGMIKVMIVKGHIKGATIVGTGAGEQICLWALAISKNMKIGDIAGFVAPYPTLAELSKRAAGAYFTPRIFESDRLKAVVRFLARFG
jgi:pyruvate/2-oxoglutarate dehydrogenase complex dihydrolipoamide dehydrogenase (E3) component